MAGLIEVAPPTHEYLSTPQNKFGKQTPAGSFDSLSKRDSNYFQTGTTKATKPNITTPKRNRHNTGTTSSTFATSVRRKHRYSTQDGDTFYQWYMSQLQARYSPHFWLSMSLITDPKNMKAHTHDFYVRFSEKIDIKVVCVCFHIFRVCN